MCKSKTSLESEKLKNVDYDLITRGVSNLHIQFLSTTVTNCFRATLQEKNHCIIVLLMNRVTCETRIVCRLPPRNKYTGLKITAGVLADLDPPRIGPPGPNPLADMDPPVHIR